MRVPCHGFELSPVTQRYVTILVSADSTAFLQLHVDAPLHVCLARNSKRDAQDRRVPPGIVQSMHEALEPPKQRPDTWEDWVLSVMNDGSADFDQLVCALQLRHASRVSSIVYTAGFSDDCVLHLCDYPSTRRHSVLHGGLGCAGTRARICSPDQAGEGSWENTSAT
jgi:hypothetical protein